MNADDLRRLARSTGFDLATLEKDYALTWLLSGIYCQDSSLASFLIFKGGTAIRKIHFPEWRLSEDMDFTVIQTGAAKEIRHGFEDAFRWLKEKSGIQFRFNSFHQSKNAVLADVQFLGPLGHKNRISHDIALKETLVDDTQRVNVKPEYDGIPEFTCLVYSVDEILVEKLRSILQRGKARDYYDVWRLTREKDFDMARIQKLFEKKCNLTGVEFRPEEIFNEAKLADAERFWKIALERLTKGLPAFETVVRGLRETLRPIAKS
jgi:uncharacterized protein